MGCNRNGAGRLDEVIEELKRLADGKMDGDAATAALLKADVVEPLRQLELELSRQLQQQSGRTNLRCATKAPLLRSIAGLSRSIIGGYPAEGRSSRQDLQDFSDLS